MFSWAFKEATPGDRARESQVEKFFSSDAVVNPANAIVREGIQNSLDAAPDDAIVRVRIRVDSWKTDVASGFLKMFEAGFREHLSAEGVRQKISKLPDEADHFRYLTFEDFGTSGLRGDPAAWWPDEHGQSEPFFNYFRAEGISGKTEGARGRHGVGRLVFMFASRTRSMFGLTRRDGKGGNSEELLMGTTVLRNHRLNDVPFLPDGWFGIPDEKVKGLTLPIQDPDFIEVFKGAFGVSRSTENGLSVVVPWLLEEVTVEEIIRAAISGYYFPILSGKLVVQVVGEGEEVKTIDVTSIDSIVAERDQQFQSLMQPMITLARRSLATTERILLNQHKQTESPKWNSDIAGDDLLAEINEALEHGQLVSIRVPMFIRQKEKSAAGSFFDLHLIRDANIGESQINFIREGIIISDARPRRTSGVRALVVIEEGPLATFLGDSENPSHTQWQKDLVKDKYSFAPGGIDFVTQAVPQLLALISQKQKKPDASLLLDLFSIPSDGGFIRPRKQSRETEGDKTTRKKLEIPKRKRRYSIERRKNGFVVRKGDADPFHPFSFIARAAYAVRKGNALSKYNSSDFQFGKQGVDLDSKDCVLKTIGANWAIVRAEAEDFEFSVVGFDTHHRDIRVEVKLLGEEEPQETGDVA